jgi:hypothetical protein
MIDRLHVTRFPVAVIPPQGETRTKALARLATMEREALHLATAIKDMRNGIVRADGRLFTSGVMNSRDWTLSVVLSHTYLQALVDAGVHSSGFPGQATPLASYQGYTLFGRAGTMGVEDGIRDRPR